MELTDNILEFPDSARILGTPYLITPDILRSLFRGLVSQ